MSAEPLAPHTDTTQSPERLPETNGFVGLHARLLLGGDALNPSVINIPQISDTEIVSFNNRSYSPF